MSDVAKLQPLNDGIEQVLKTFYSFNTPEVSTSESRLRPVLWPQDPNPCSDCCWCCCSEPYHEPYRKPYHESCHEPCHDPHDRMILTKSAVNPFSDPYSDLCNDPSPPACCMLVLDTLSCPPTCSHLASSKPDAPCCNLAGPSTLTCAPTHGCHSSQKRLTCLWYLAGDAQASR